MRLAEIVTDILLFVSPNQQHQVTVESMNKDQGD